MSTWEFLSIAPTVDAKMIKLAYAALLKKYHPDKDPEGFQKLRDAYEACLDESRKLKHSRMQDGMGDQDQSERNVDEVAVQSHQQKQTHWHAHDKFQVQDSEYLVQAAMEEITELYKDFHKRIDLSRWLSILDADIFQRIDLKSALNHRLFAFIADHPNLPGEVCSLLEQRFDWVNQPVELAGHFKEDVLDIVFWRLQHAKIKHDYLGLKETPAIDFDTYIALREEAAHLMAQNENSKAGDLLEQAEAIYSNDPILMFLIGQLAERRSDIEEAVKRYSRMIAAAPERIEGYLYRANIYLEQGRIKEALDDFQWILEQEANNFTATKGLAQCHERMENFEEAKLLYELALELRGSDFEIIIAVELLNNKLIELYEATDGIESKRLKALARCYLNSHRPVMADKTLEQCPIKDPDIYLLTGESMIQQNIPYQEVNAVFQKGLEAAEATGENGYDLLMDRGKLLSNNNVNADAAETYKAAWALNPNDPGIAQQVARALFYAEDGRDDEALAWIERAIEAAPDRYAFQQTKGHILFEAQQWEEALKALDLYIDTQYNAPFERYAKGICHYWLDQHDAAAQSLSMAQQMGRSDNDLPYYLCISYYKSGQYKEAYTQINMYLVDCWEKYFLTGKIEVQLGIYDKALASFTAGGERFGSWDCFAGTACCYLYLADYKNVLAMLESLDSAVPDQPWTLFNLAAIYCIDSQWDACLETASHYIRQCNAIAASIDCEIHYYRSMAYYRSNNLMRAIEAAKKAFAAGAPKLHYGVYLSMLNFECGQISEAIRTIVEIGSDDESIQLQALLSALRKSKARDSNVRPDVSYETYFPDVRLIAPPHICVEAIPSELN